MNDQTCSQCQAIIPEGTGIATESAVFCQPCYQELTRILEESLGEQGKNINYPGAISGGLAGGLLAAGVWWGFTIVTKIQFGLVAVLIGWATAKGVVMMSGGKRALSLQLISVGITLFSFAMATYWVTRTYVMDYMAENGIGGGLPLWPEAGFFTTFIIPNFEIWDFVFLAIALWQAWKGPAPIVLRHPE